MGRPVSVTISTTRPPAGGLVARELAQAGLGQCCPVTCARTTEVPVDGVCADCGRRRPVTATRRTEAA